MSDSIAPVGTAVAPAPAVTRAPALAAKDGLSQDIAPAPAEPRRPPITVDVARDDGVFVYTLRDPATDVVFAVIPREEVLTARERRALDERV